MRPPLLGLGLAALIAPLLAQQSPSPDAASIMAQVAANQDQSQAERAHFLYVQHAKVTSRKGSTVRCEEITDSRVIPSESRSHQQLLKLDGRLLTKGHYVAYTQLAPRARSGEKPEGSKADEGGQPVVDNEAHGISISVGEGGELDRDLVEDMRSDLTNDKTRDGLAAGLFPLTTKVQAEYQYTLVGQESMNGRQVFHISFKPKDKDDFGWKGDAYIDRIAFQPVLVRTTMSRKIPFAVRTLLGTSLPGLGFTTIYAPEPAEDAEKPGSLWFPVSFGTEFKMHILFFLNRTITVSVENRQFEKTHVVSTIHPTE